jgi:glutamate carboxypeptidase
MTSSPAEPSGTLPDLAFEPASLLARLRPWVETESPTFDRAAVNRMMDLAAQDMAQIGATIERIPGRLGFGDCVRARLPHAAPPGTPGILVLAHLDTVHPVGTLAKLPWRLEGPRLFGPGAFDMKGGTVLAVAAAARLLAARIATPLPVTFLFTSDEEVGSPATRALIEAEAARARYVLVPEPARQDGGVVTGRYAIARFNLRTIGRPSHAGMTLAEGRSAIREMCRQALDIEAMSSEACTFSVGIIQGGTWVNCVATECHAEVLSMAKRQDDLEAGVARMLGLAASHPDVTLLVTRGVTRPVWEPDAGTLALHAHAARLAAQLGLALPHQSSGGGSDGNFTGAMGVPTLDGLGVAGAGAHTLDEQLLVDSLVPRARLFAGLLATLS